MSKIRVVPFWVFAHLIACLATLTQINPEAKIISDDERIRPSKSEVERLLGANGKIKNLTGWVPNTTLTEGLAQTITWFSNSENLKSYKADIYNV